MVCKPALSVLGHAPEKTPERNHADSKMAGDALISTLDTCLGAEACEELFVSLGSQVFEFLFFGSFLQKFAFVYSMLLENIYANSAIRPQMLLISLWGWMAVKCTLTAQEAIMSSESCTRGSN